MISENNINTVSNPPFFTVIITTLNRAKLITRAIRSLLLQTEKDWEAVIIDDGSTDNTEDVVAAFLRPEDHIRYIKRENSGCAASKNAGIFSARGKYITFLDSDDEYNPAHLATRKTILTNGPEIDFLHGGIEVIGSSLVPDRFDHKKLIHLRDCVIGGTFFVKRPLAVKLNGFRDIPLGHDADFFARAEKMNISIVKTHIPTYIYHRETQNSITNNYASKGRDL